MSSRHNPCLQRAIQFLAVVSTQPDYIRIGRDRAYRYLIHCIHFSPVLEFLLVCTSLLGGFDVSRASGIAVRDTLARICDKIRKIGSVRGITLRSIFGPLPSNTPRTIIVVFRGCMIIGVVSCTGLRISGTSHDHILSVVLPALPCCRCENLAGSGLHLALHWKCNRRHHRLREQ